MIIGQRVAAKTLFVLQGLVLSILFLSCSNDKGLAPEEYYGYYVISKYQVYGGGITTDEFANGLIGGRVKITANEFAIRDVSIKKPVYKIEMVSLNVPEGEVLPDDLSAFHGYESNRGEIKRILVFESKNEKEPFERLEILEDGTLLDMFDGRFYFITPTQGPV